VSLLRGIRTSDVSRLTDEYVKTGKMRYVLRDFPLEEAHPLAEKAAEAAHCAGEQGKYWEMHERLFSNQSALESKELSRHAASVGLDVAKFDECLDSGRFAARIKADRKEGAKLNIRGTPTFFFGYTDESDPARVRAVKVLSGTQPFDAFVDILDELLNAPQEATRTQ
jgi:protein-disulfide isomerase